MTDTDGQLVLNVSSDNEEDGLNSEGRAIVVEAEVLDDIAERIETRVVTAIEERYHSGPLPPPDTLAAYEAAVPGLASVIVQQMQDTNLRANKEQTHRHDMQGRSIAIAENVSRAEISTTRIGQISAIVIVLVLLTLVVYLITNGYKVEGFVTLAVTLGGVVASQILPKRSIRGPEGADEIQKAKEE